jgi:valyl-tRNA synthetase
VAALRHAIDTLLRLFAPFLPYVTEEVWSWWREGSVHRAAWPSPDELGQVEGADLELYEAAAWVLGEIRKEKALAKVSLRVPCERVEVLDTAERLRALEPAEVDLREAGNVVELVRIEADEPAVHVRLGAPEPA